MGPDAEVELHQRPDEVPAHRLHHRLAVRLRQVLPHIVMGLGLGVGTAGIRCQGLPHDGLAHLFITEPGQPFIDIHAGLLVGFNKPDVSPGRHDTRGIRPHPYDGIHQGCLILFTGRCVIGPQPQGHPVDLAETDPVLQVIVFKQVHPGHHPQHAIPGRVARTRLVTVDDELVFRKGYPSRERLRPEHERIGQGIIIKLFLVDVLNVPHHHMAVPVFPLDFLETDALSDGIQDVHEVVAEPVQLLQLFLHESRYLLVCSVLRKGLHLPVQARHRKLAGLQLGEQMGVLAFHLLEQLHLPEGVPGVRLLEYPGQLYRCQAVRRVAAEFIVHIPDGNRCHDGPPAFCHFRW